MSKRCAYMNIGLPLVMIVLGLVLALIGPNFIHVRGGRLSTPPRPRNMALVKNFPRRMFAEMAGEALEKEGIPSWIQSPDIGILGVRGGAVPQGADLHVKDEHAERARELLSALFRDL